MKVEISLIISQIVAFLIMLWVLKRFAWQPLQNMLQARKDKIASDFAAIEEQKIDNEQLKQAYQKKLAEIEIEAREKIAAAQEEGRKKALHIQEEAQMQAKAILQKAQKDIENEVVKAQKKLKSNLVHAVIGATEQLINRKFASAEDKEMIGEFVDKI